MTVLDVDAVPRRRAEHLGPQRRRPQVLDAALAITAESGVGAVTIGSLAARLNVTRPVIYACFGDRVEVIAALLQRETAQLTDALVGSLYSARGDTAEDAFVTGFRALLRVVEARPQSWRFVFFTAPDPAVASRFIRVRTQLGDALSGRLRPVLSTWWSMADAHVDRVLPVLVEHVMSSGEAAVRSMLDDSTTWTADDLGALYGRMVTHAFGAASETPDRSNQQVKGNNS